jgi:signal peptidase I
MDSTSSPGARTAASTASPTCIVVSLARAVVTTLRERWPALIGGSAVVLGGLVLVGVVLAGKWYRIPSPAMELTLRCAEPAVGCSGRANDRVFALRYVLGRVPERGDVVAFRSNDAFEARCGQSGLFVKRIAGLPGERIEARDGTVFVDSAELDEPYARYEPRGPWAAASRRVGPVLVPQDEYFLLSDNRGAGCDSFVWGSLPRRDLVAEVVAIYWPPGRIGRP